MKGRRAALRFHLVFLLMLASSLMICSWASASAITDIKENLADTMGVSDYAAGMFLSMGVIVALALVLALLKMRPIGILITMLAAMITLAAISWLDKLVVVFTVVVVAIYFAGTVKTIMTG